MSHPNVQKLVEEATFHYTLEENELALAKLEEALKLNPNSFEAWHAKTEILFSQKDLAKALEAGERAHNLNPEDIHINTSLSRIWVEKGDKPKAEHYNAQARMLSWKEQIEAESK